MKQNYDVVVVGAGHSGAAAAIALRQAGFDGSVALIGEESDPPYERPPLSKEYLAGQKAFDRLLIRPPAFWSERRIALLLGKRVTAVDAKAHRLSIADGTMVGYRQLIWAAGGHPRRLACAGRDLVGVHTLRTRADADCLRERLPEVTRALVVGGGFIGLEAAAVLVRSGSQVVLVEALDRVLARVVGGTLSRFYETEHRAHGVDVRLNSSVESILGNSSGAVSGVRLADGGLIACDIVIVGIGIVPAVEPLLAAGAIGANGVAVDGQCRTSLPDVFAIGDCAAFRSRYAGGEVVRVESVQNAHDQAATVAKVIVGQVTDYDALPWFWSNQYDLKLQTVGLAANHDHAIVRGDVKARSFSVVYLKSGKVIALDCVNNVKDYVQGRKLIMEGLAIKINEIKDPTVQLKDVTQSD